MCICTLCSYNACPSSFSAVLISSISLFSFVIPALFKKHTSIVHFKYLKLYDMSSIEKYKTQWKCLWRTNTGCWLSNSYFASRQTALGSDHLPSLMGGACFSPQESDHIALQCLSSSHHPGLSLLTSQIVSDHTLCTGTYASRPRVCSHFLTLSVSCSYSTNPMEIILQMNVFTCWLDTSMKASSDRETLAM